MATVDPGEFRVRYLLQELEELHAWPWDTARPGSSSGRAGLGLGSCGCGQADRYRGNTAATEIFKINYTIAERLAGENGRRCHGQRLASRALAVVDGDADLERLQRVQLRCSVNQAAQVTMETVERKKTRPAYIGRQYRLHLVCTNRALCFTQPTATTTRSSRLSREPIMVLSKEIGTSTGYRPLGGSCEMVT